MLKASFADHLNARGNNASRSNIIVVEKETNGERILRQQKEKEIQIHEQESKRLFNERRKILGQRSSLVYQIIQCQTVRKDGMNVAKPGRKERRDELQAELRLVNRRLSFLDAHIAKHMGNEKPERELSDQELLRRAKEERDNHIVIMLHVEKIDPLTCDEDLKEITNELAYAARPDNGYPAPPFRRGDDYPVGALNNPPKETSIEHIAGERDRIEMCIANIVRKEGITDRVIKMRNHLENLKRYVYVLASRNAHVRAKPGTKEYQLHGAERAA